MTPRAPGSRHVRQWFARTGAAVLVTAALAGAPAAAWALDPARRLSDYSHDVWNMTDGLPQDSITGIVQTDDGYLWLGTLDGLARFDGVRFESFNLIQKAGVGGNVVTALVERPGGGLFIGTRDGLVQYADGTFTSLSRRDGPTDLSVRALFVDRAGTLWIATRWTGLKRLQNGSVTSFGPADGLLNQDVRTVAEDGRGTIWVGTAAGLNYIRDGKVLSAAFNGRAGAPPVVASLHVDRRGVVWAGTDDGLWAVAAGQPGPESGPVVVRRQPLPGGEVRAFCEDAEGTLWAGLTSGLARLRDGTIEITRWGELSHHNVRSLATDREGSLWIGTDGGGLNRFRDASVVMMGAPPGQQLTSIMPVYRDANGAMWTGANCGGVTRWSASGTKTFTTRDGLPSDCIRSLAGEPDGTLWIGTIAGLARLKGGRITRYTTADGLSNNRVMAIAVDRAGAVWLGTGGSGIDRLENGRVTNYSTKNGLNHNDVRAVLVGRDGGVWIGTLGGGLHRWRNGTMESFTRADGLSNNNVLALAEDPDGTLWIGTNGGGLNRFRNGVLTSFTTEHGLFSDGVFQILDDGAGSLWMGCNRGVFRVSRQELEDVASGRRTSVSPASFSRAEGLKPAGAMGGTQPSGAIDAGGRLWFPTIEGVAVIDRRHVVRNSVPPPVHIERVAIDGQVVAGEGLASIPPGSREVEIQFTALSYVAPAKVRFKYRLAGFSDAWVDIGTRRTAYFTNLKPGRYRFQVQASNNDGVWNRQGDALDFVLMPHFYETGPFFAVCGVCGLLLILGGYRWRERRLRSRQRELSDQVDQAMAEIKVLSGLLPICASCKRIRDDRDDWKAIETYIHEHSQAKFSHGICPDCMKRLYPDFHA